MLESNMFRILLLLGAVIVLGIMLSIFFGEEGLSNLQGILDGFFRNRVQKY